ncbi:hypothetical protein AVEN_257389-1 [Araneus ventricosus]|uniref:Uncharacterized protein n=1 Tax=Araneus ventricosus TaxID=182803 RepID=A0A4Y2CAH9_ARAVE|nr:hypothetical protein AVEN_257389-1 [Araneus ventricosus]
MSPGSYITVYANIQYAFFARRWIGDNFVQLRRGSSPKNEKSIELNERTATFSYASIIWLVLCLDSSVSEEKRAFISKQYLCLLRQIYNFGVKTRHPIPFIVALLSYSAYLHIGRQNRQTV